MRAQAGHLESTGDGFDTAKDGEVRKPPAFPESPVKQALPKTAVAGEACFHSTASPEQLLARVP